MRRAMPALALVLPLILMSDANRAQTAPTGFGVLGDSGSDEYRADDNRGGGYSATTFNWLELLVRYRTLNAGAWNTRPEPRRTGYEFNWARSSARAADLVAQGQADGLAAQVAEGRVSHVLVMVGVNDFASWNGTYAEIYEGRLTGAALDDKLDAVVANMRMAIEKIQQAGPVTVFVANLGDRGTTPAFQRLFPDPAGRQLVTDATIALNARIQSMSAARGAIVVDLFGFANVMLQRVDANGYLHVGSESISVNQIGNEPHHMILADDEHLGTIASALLANYLIESFNAHGLSLAPFTDQEMLDNAGIVPPDTTAPTVAVAAPAEGAVVAGSVTVSASAADNVGVGGVQFTLDGVNLGTEDTTAPYSRTWSTGIPQNGVHTLGAIARDAAGNTTVATTRTVTVHNIDTTAPNVSLTAPGNGAQIVGALTISASASDNVGVAGVTFTRNGVAVAPEDTTAPYTVTVQTNYTQNGSSTLAAIARDAAGNQRTSSSRTVTIANPVPDSVAPTVTLSNPVGDTTVGSVVTISASAFDNIAVAGVRFAIDGVNLGSEDKSAPYSIGWNTTTAVNGTHSVSATARDAAGNTATASATITVSNVPTIVNPGAYAVTLGSYQAGTLADVAADDNLFLVTRSAASNGTGYARTDFEFAGLPAAPLGIDVAIVAKSSASSTSLRVYAFNVTTNAWTQLSSSTVGTAEAASGSSITGNAAAYRDSAGRMRVRVQGSKGSSTFSVSHDVVRISVLH